MAQCGVWKLKRVRHCVRWAEWTDGDWGGLAVQGKEMKKEIEERLGGES